MDFPVDLQSRKMLCSKQNASTHCALGKQYNIPVSLWLKESYPHTAPICYLKPTREMVVVTSRYVSSNGEIMLPYLDEWKHVRLQLEYATMVLAYHKTNNFNVIAFYEMIFVCLFGGLFTEAVWLTQLDSGYDDCV